MHVELFSPFDGYGCEERIRRKFSTANIEVEGHTLIVTDGRYRLRLALEGWGGPANNQNRFGGVRAKVDIDSKVLEAVEETLDDLDKKKIGEMVRLAIDTLQPIEEWQDDRKATSLDSF